MKQAEFSQRIREARVIFDGATGTLLQAQGLPPGSSPEAFCAEHPEVIAGIQEHYLQAGAQVICAPTFGANRPKLAHYGLENQGFELNRKLTANSKKIANRYQAMVAGNIGPTGLFLEPFGEMGFEAGVDIFKEQIRGLVEGGADFLYIETQIDIQEARAAVIAARECSDLAVIVSMTFDEHGKTLTGSDPLTCLVILHSLSIAAFGMNCSTGPEPMLEHLKRLHPIAQIPLLVKPNAGLPVVDSGRTLFPMGPEEFGAWAKPLTANGAHLLGGCCGTSPQHIAALVAACRELPNAPFIPANPEGVFLAGPRRTICLGGKQPIRLIGERINPTGKPTLQDELAAGRYEELKRLAREQEQAGADLLDVNVGTPGVEETAALRQAVCELAVATDCPLCLDSTHPQAMAAALRIYPGRALMNSISGEQAKQAALLKLAAQYGAGTIALPVTDAGIPAGAEERISNIESWLKTAAAQGISSRQVVVDALVMTVATSPEHAYSTLAFIRHASREMGLATVIGLSNISFGLPARGAINRAFLAMAASAGLTSVIANPGDAALCEMLDAGNLLAGRDPGAARFIARRQRPGAGSATTKPDPKIFDPLAEVAQGILWGEKNGILPKIQKALDAGVDPSRLVEEAFIPAIREVGAKYERREYFLPQLVSAAETMEIGMQELGPRLATTGAGRKATGVIATVKGDVHDIGKKIVAMMLRNSGYRIIDLGKSVSAETIVEAARQEQAELILLSALMTTTMCEMEEVVRQVRANGLKAKVMIGGAVVTAAFAQQIGADGYSADAHSAVAKAEELSGTPIQEQPHA